jgi:hypothetical protein
MEQGEQERLKHLQLWQEEEIQADSMRLTKYPCPCMECAGGKVLDRATIRKHLRTRRRDPVFTASILVSDFNHPFLSKQSGVVLRTVPWFKNLRS